MASANGFSMVPNWIIRDSNLTKNELLVYIALLNRVDSKGLAFPSIRTIAKASRTSERTVQTTLKALEDKGMLVKYLRLREDGTNQSNLYQVKVFEDPEPSLMAPGGRVQELHPHGAPVAVEVNTLEVNPLSTSKAHSSSELREASSDSSSALTDSQLAYLRDLHILTFGAIPDVDRWLGLSRREAATYIQRALRAVPRGHDYAGPSFGDLSYIALSARGQRLADVRMHPNVPWEP
jgi:hypothetical protein